MKKKLAVIALTGFALFGTAAYLHAHAVTHSTNEEGILHMGTRCGACNGTGFQGNWNCFHCKGTGRTMSY